VNISKFLNLDKIRTSPQPGPRMAVVCIRKPHQQNCMVEVCILILPLKVHPGKKYGDFSVGALLQENFC
jgi:hypothetical protein